MGPGESAAAAGAVEVGEVGGGSIAGCNGRCSGRRRCQPWLSGVGFQVCYMQALALEKYKLNNLTLESDSETLNRGNQRNQCIIIDCGDRF